MRVIGLMAAGAAAAMGVGVCGAAFANDSTAELAAGGLLLTHNAAIQMQSENLSISDQQVKVHYVFANITNADVTVTVAFPMPDITIDGPGTNIAVSTDGPPINFLNFTTVADGKPVTAQVEQKVLLHGVDYTAYLTSLHIPLAPQLDATNAAIMALPRATIVELVHKGLAFQDGDNDYMATWTLKTTYYWQQTFPAGRTIVIDHQYTPAVGRSEGSSWGSANFPRDPTYRAQVAKYCVDSTFLDAVKHTVDPSTGFSTMQEERIDYILSSGANWAAPIGDFTMTIDKGDPTRLISFCGTNLQKISPTQFQVHYTNFTPRGDVSVLILLHPSAQ